MRLQANLSLNKLCLFCILQLSLYDQSLRAISDTLHGFFDEPSQASTMDWSLWANQTKYILWLQQCPLKRIELEELGDCHFWWQSQQKSRKGRSCYMTASTMWNGRSLETWCQWRTPGVITLLSSWDLIPKSNLAENYQNLVGSGRKMKKTKNQSNSVHWIQNSLFWTTNSVHWIGGPFFGPTNSVHWIGVPFFGLPIQYTELVGLFWDLPIQYTELVGLFLGPPNSVHWIGGHFSENSNSVYWIGGSVGWSWNSVDWIVLFFGFLSNSIQWMDWFKTKFLNKCWIWIVKKNPNRFFTNKFDPVL